MATTGSDEQVAELLERPQDGVERLGQVVDGAEDAALERRNRPVPHHDRADDEHHQSDDCGNDVGASSDVSRCSHLRYVHEPLHLAGDDPATRP